MACKTYRFDELFELKIGGTPSRRNESFWDKKGKGLPWVSIANLNQGLLSSTSETITPEGVSNSNVKLIPAGTTIISFKLSIGKKSKLAMDAYTNEAICALVVKDHNIIDEGYLFHAIDKVDFLSNVDQAIKGVTLNKKKLAELTISLPSLQEQRRIAGILSTWEKAINAYDRLIALKEKQKRGLMQNLLSSSEYPKVQLGDVCEHIRNGFSYKPLDGGVPITRIESISHGVVDLGKVGFAEPDPKMLKFLMEQGDILFSNINSPSHLGKVAFYEGGDELFHGMNLLCIRANRELAEPLYLYYMLSSSFGKRMAARYGKIAVNQSSISASDVKKYTLSIPPLEDQQRIAGTLSKWDKSISCLSRKRDLLKQQKQGLMQQLLA